MEHGGGLLQPLYSMCLNEIIKCAASTWMKEQRNDNLTTLLNRSSKYDVEVLADVVKARLLD